MTQTAVASSGKRRPTPLLSLSVNLDHARRGFDRRLGSTTPEDHHRRIAFVQKLLDAYAEFHISDEHLAAHVKVDDFGEEEILSPLPIGAGAMIDQAVHSIHQAMDPSADRYLFRRRLQHQLRQWRTADEAPDPNVQTFIESLDERVFELILQHHSAEVAKVSTGG